MIYLLLFVLLAILIVTFFLNKKDIIAPSFIFTFGFVFQAFWAVLYSKKWELGLHINTFLVITLGVLEFALVAYLVNLIYKRKTLETNSYKNVPIKLNKILKILYLIFIILFSFIYLYFIVKSVNGNFDSLSNISSAIAKYDSMVKFSDQFNTVKLPFIISNLSIVVVASGYWFLFTIINNFIYNKKIDIIEVAIVISCAICSVLNGTRGDAFMMMVSGIVYFLVIYSKNKEFKNVLNFKMIRNITVIGVVFLATFFSFASLLGRNIKESKLDYLSIYCGAEVKNLDLFLQEKEYKKQNDIFGSQTFYSLILTVGEKVGFKNYKRYQLDLPFRQVNQVNLGNVYTTFYPYIYDFGYFGMFILVMLMAIISQIVYEKVKSLKFKSSPSILILFYSLIFSCLILSFFSNKFYENIFSMKMLKFVITWLVLNFIFFKLNFKNIKQKILKK